MWRTRTPRRSSSWHVLRSRKHQTPAPSCRNWKYTQYGQFQHRKLHQIPLPLKTPTSHFYLRNSTKIYMTHFHRMTWLFYLHCCPKIEIVITEHWKIKCCGSNNAQKISTWMFTTELTCSMRTAKPVFPLSSATTNLEKTFPIKTSLSYLRKIQTWISKLSLYSWP